MSISFISWEQYLKDKQSLSETDKYFMKLIEQHSDDEKKSEPKEDLSDFIATIKNIVVHK